MYAASAVIANISFVAFIAFSTFAQKIDAFFSFARAPFQN